MKPTLRAISIASANGGISNDEFVGQKNSFYESENIEIRKDSQYLFLTANPSTNTLQKMFYSLYPSGMPTVINYVWEYTVTDFGIVWSWWVPLCTTNDAGIPSDYLIYDRVNNRYLIHKDTVFVKLPALWPALWVNKFSSRSATADWTSSWWGYTHNTGNTTSLVANISAVTGGKFHIVTVAVTGRTAGSFNIMLGTQKVADSVTASGTYWIIAFDSWGATTLSFVPTSTFDGNVVLTSIQEVTTLSSWITGVGSWKRQWHDVLWHWEILYFNGKKIYYIDQTALASGGAAYNCYTAHDNIVGLHIVGDSVFVFSETWLRVFTIGSMTSGTALADPTAYIKWRNTTLHNTVDYGGKILVTGKSWNEHMIFEAVGYDKQLLFRSNELDQHPRILHDTNDTVRTISVNDKAYMIAYWGWCREFGKQNPWVPESLSKINKTWLSTTTAIGSNGTTAIILGGYDGTNYVTQYFPIWYVWSSANTYGGYIEWVIYGTAVDIIKELQAVQVWYKLPASTTAISLIARLDDDYTYSVWYYTGTTVTVWDVYSYSGSNFTVSKVNAHALGWFVVEWQRTSWNTTIADNAVMTKVSWSWPTPITITRSYMWMRINQMTDINYRQFTTPEFNQQFYKMNIKLVFHTSVSWYSPSVSRLNLAFNEIQDEFY